MNSKIMSFVIGAMTLLYSATVFAASPIKIGALFAVTGPAAFLGVKGHKLELVVYDTTGDATKAVQLATKLIKDDKVVAIIGPSTTGETMAVIPVAEKEQVPLISCSAGSKITDPVKKWIFKTAQNDSLAVGKIYEYLQKTKQTSVSILTVSDGFGASGREQLKSQAVKYGITIVSDDTYGPKDTDMTAQLTKIRGSRAQAIICWGTNPGPAIIAKNVRQLGIKTPVFMSHGVSSKKFIDLAGEAAEGIKLPSGKVVVADLLPGSDKQKNSLMDFVKDYQNHYKAEGDHFGGHAWDAVMLIRNAVEHGADSAAAIRDQLEKSKGFAGIGGSFNYSAQDHAGLGKDAFVLVEIRNKDWVIVK